MQRVAPIRGTMNGVYAIAQQVAEWVGAGRDVRVAVVVASRGFSSREPAAAMAWTDGDGAVGALVGGISPDQLPEDGLVDVTLSEDDAIRAGLACGGTVTILVRSAADFPPDTWERLVDRDPLCLVIPVGTSAAQLFTATTIRDAYPFGDEVPRLFGRGVTATALIDDAAVVVLWPVPTLVVVGEGLIADALRDLATLLGWNPAVTPEVQSAVAAVADLEPSDAVVVLSHDRAADGPTLAAALAGRAGYVGALGSRRTQAARREWLTEHAVAVEAQARIHGPAGLDIDAHTPGEIAVSIVAEILASRSKAAGGALRDREGPVHTAGVNAPPPRY
jgi:xanthine dehydrogenase accessory factor